MSELVAAFLSAAMLMLTAQVEPFIPDAVEVPILMYHHLDETGNGSVTVTAETFEEHLILLRDAGYEAVSFDELIDYVDHGYELPEKPICIVFDDGYESVLTLALPLLCEYECKATVCVIGSSVGRDTYNGTDIPILPHFSKEDFKTFRDSGLVTVASHTYNMHQTPKYEDDIVRRYAVPLPGESERHFRAVFDADYLAMKRMGCDMSIFAYPHGVHHELTEQLLTDYGVRVTLTTDAHVNTVTRGDAGSLHLLGRYNINEETDMTALLEGFAASKTP